jgi:hypothetical protein
MKWQSGKIAEYYPMALAEGEGVGTAYEYVAKERKLRDLLEKVSRGSRILIAGIPEQYGYSLDFCNIAMRIGAHLTVIDDRPERLNVHKKLVGQVLGTKAMMGIDYFGLRSLDRIGDLTSERFQFTFSCEVIQRLPRSERKDFINSVASISDCVVFFAPNGDNPEHASRSRLKALRLDALKYEASSAGTIVKSGYTDMPPFPPGIRRNDQQRAQVISSRSQRILIQCLELWCPIETVLPAFIQKRFCHIVYVALKTNRTESYDDYNA